MSVFVKLSTMKQQNKKLKRKWPQWPNADYHLKGKKYRKTQSNISELSAALEEFCLKYPPRIQTDEDEWSFLDDSNLKMVPENAKPQIKTDINKNGTDNVEVQSEINSVIKHDDCNQKMKPENVKTDIIENGINNVEVQS